MLRHLPSDTGAPDRLLAVAPADGQLIHLVAISVAAMCEQRIAAAIGLSRFQIVS